MEQLGALLPLVIFLALWTWFIYLRSGRRAWSPLWLAFTTTALALLFVGAGAVGYTLSKRARFSDETAWADGVIWWQIAVGFGAALAAIYFWRQGLRDIRAR
jgi:hypothetical protein